ncbi:MAM and LDL-receptor class A domain-containing protein 1-like isoform X2 [Liolophura sinensis]|uniref:MAM and LDL-receptor class A domain-containing protein 1-like isoform X2 n=1 Tax=Liolophura sinensis TaxID=3198878 RepID=UPI0031596D39
MSFELSGKTLSGLSLLEKKVEVIKWSRFRVDSVRPVHYGDAYPEENEGVNNRYLMEGDILMDVRRNAVRDHDAIWMSRVVPYTLDESYSPDVRHEIHLALTEFENLTCIKFKPVEDEVDFIRITPLKGCFSPVGRKGGPQDVSIGTGCNNKGTIMHEIMHALGFWHEHSRPDRDHYIEIMWDNIAEDHKHNFNKFDFDEIDTLGAPYDYGSIMHYAANTFAADRSVPTIVPKFPTRDELGQRKGLSATDVLKIRKLYNCNISQCRDPGTPLKGFRQGSNFSVGRTVSFICPSRYTLVGSRERYCKDSGEWTGYIPVCIPGSIFYCNLDRADLCGWKQETSDDLDFQWAHSSTPTADTGPKEDHTMGSSFGSYLFLESSTPAEVNQKARLISPTLQPFSSSICMRFYHHMMGDGIGDLRIYIRENGHESRILTLSGEQGRDWQFADVSFTPTLTFEVIFEAVRGRTFRGDIAIDDIILSPCDVFNNFTNLLPGDSRTKQPPTVPGGSKLPVSLSCDFDENLCGFTQSTRDNFDWWNQSGPTITVNTGPECDRQQCDLGKYMYIEASAPRIKGDKAAIISPRLEGGGVRCLSFYYHMYGDQMGDLTVRALIGDQNMKLWSQSGDQGKRWHAAEHEFRPTTAYQISFEATRGPGYRSDIAIDDVDISDGPCLGSSGISCDFELDFCGWTDDTNDDFDWIRNSGATGTPGTGPTGDHTSSRGYYIYIETSAPRIQGEHANLASPVILPRAQGYCFSFWYHMYGMHIQSLRIKVVSETGHTSEIWEMEGEKGNRWTKEELSINYAIAPFQIVLEGEAGHSYRGDIAIDDISLRHGAC